MAKSRTPLFQGSLSEMFPKTVVTPLKPVESKYILKLIASASLLNIFVFAVFQEKQGTV